MKCPKCKEYQLEEKSVKDGKLLLDWCRFCKGLWFDKGELNTVLGKRSAGDLEVPKSSLKNKDIYCPTCNENLYEFLYPGTTIFIDMCRSCHGVWLDNREWNEIAVVRSENNKLVCPKCHTKQKKSLSCQSCGIVFSKYDRSSNAKVPSEDNKESIGDVRSTESYADNIPGLKGALLRFIDRKISNLSNFK